MRTFGSPRNIGSRALIRSMLAALPPSFCHTVMASCGINQPSGKKLPPATEVGARHQGAKFASECRPPCAECGAAAPCAASPLPASTTITWRATGRRLAGEYSAPLPAFFIAVLIGVGATLAWQSHGDDAKQIVRTWAPSLGWLFPVSTTKSPPDGPVSAQDAALPQSAPVTQRTQRPLRL